MRALRQIHARLITHPLCISAISFALSKVVSFSALSPHGDIDMPEREMQKAGVVPDEVTMVSVISACAASGAFDVGRWVHAYTDKHLIDTDLEVSTALVNTYAKCGCIEKAREVFDAVPVKDTKAWSSMIVGLAIHGLAEDALDAFSRMEETKVKPNHVTFVGVLLACGQVSKRKKYWSNMLVSGVEPSMEHYGCIVDLLCRADLVEEAFTFVETMPVTPNPVIWRTLLVGCSNNRNADKGSQWERDEPCEETNE